MKNGPGENLSQVYSRRDLLREGAKGTFRLSVFFAGIGGCLESARAIDVDNETSLRSVLEKLHKAAREEEGETGAAGLLWPEDRALWFSVGGGREMVIVGWEVMKARFNRFRLNMSGENVIQVTGHNHVIPAMLLTKKNRDRFRRMDFGHGELVDEIEIALEKSAHRFEQLITERSITGPSLEDLRSRHRSFVVEPGGVWIYGPGVAAKEDIHSNRELDESEDMNLYIEQRYKILQASIFSPESLDSEVKKLQRIAESGGHTLHYVSFDEPGAMERVEKLLRGTH